MEITIENLKETNAKIISVTLIQKHNIIILAGETEKIQSDIVDTIEVEVDELNGLPPYKLPKINASEKFTLHRVGGNGKIMLS